MCYLLDTDRFNLKLDTKMQDLCASAYLISYQWWKGKEGNDFLR